MARKRALVPDSGIESAVDAPQHGNELSQLGPAGTPLTRLPLATNTRPRTSARACRSTVRTVKSVADTNDTVLSAALTTPITWPAELVCSSASLQAAVSASPNKQTRLMSWGSPRDHNTQTDPPAPRSRRADEVWGHARSAPRT